MHLLSAVRKPQPTGADEPRQQQREAEPDRPRGERAAARRADAPPESARDVAGRDAAGPPAAARGPVAARGEQRGSAAGRRSRSAGLRDGRRSGCPRAPRGRAGLAGPDRPARRARRRAQRRIGHAPAPAAHAHRALARHPAREHDAAGAGRPHRAASREVDAAVLAARERVGAQVEEARRRPATGGVQCGSAATAAASTQHGAAERSRRCTTTSDDHEGGGEEGMRIVGDPMAGARRAAAWGQSVRSCAPFVTARYRSLAAPPVSSATTEAAGRGAGARLDQPADGVDRGRVGARRAAARRR